MDKERKASVTYTGNGTQKVFSFPFDYLRKAFVKAEIIEGSAITELTQGKDYSVLDKELTLFNPAIAKDKWLKIYRETTTDPLVEWQDASVLRASEMSLQEIQLLHLAEETYDKVQDGGLTKNNKTHQWDADYARITNVEDPIDPKDAVNLEYITDKKNGVITEVAINGNKWINSIDTDGAKWIGEIKKTGVKCNADVEEVGNYYLDTLRSMKDSAEKYAGFDLDNYYTVPEIDTMEVSDEDIISLFDNKAPVALPIPDYDIMFATDVDILNLFK